MHREKTTKCEAKTILSSSKNLEDLETLMSKELSKVKNWCDANKSSINLKKTNFMIIKSAQKKLNTELKIVIPNDGAYHTLEKKTLLNV